MFNYFVNPSNLQQSMFPAVLYSICLFDQPASQPSLRASIYPSNHRCFQSRSLSLHLSTNLTHPSVHLRPSLHPSGQLIQRQYIRSLVGQIELCGHLLEACSFDSAVCPLPLTLLPPPAFISLHLPPATIKRQRMKQRNPAS